MTDIFCPICGPEYSACQSNYDMVTRLAPVMCIHTVVMLMFDSLTWSSIMLQYACTCTYIYMYYGNEANVTHSSTNGVHVAGACFLWKCNYLTMVDILLLWGHGSEQGRCSLSALPLSVSSWTGKGEGNYFLIWKESWGKALLNMGRVCAPNISVLFPYQKKSCKKQQELPIDVMRFIPKSWQQ